jgi:hypothetical protein
MSDLMRVFIEHESVRWIRYCQSPALWEGRPAPVHRSPPAPARDPMHRRSSSRGAALVAAGSAELCAGIRRRRSAEIRAISIRGAGARFCEVYELVAARFTGRRRGCAAARRPVGSDQCVSVFLKDSQTERSRCSRDLPDAAACALRSHDVSQFEA